MSEIQEKHYRQMSSYVGRQAWVFEEKKESHCQRIDVQHGKSKCAVKVYENGTIQLQGANSQLKAALNQAKVSIEKEEPIGELLPFEIEEFPERLKERIPEIDPIIVRFVDEAIQCLKAGSLLGCAFLLGGASEKAMLLVVETYAKAIENEQNRKKFQQKVSGKFIAKVYDEFKQSFKSSKNKPKELGWTNDLDLKIEQVFQFCRLCRNEAGHPQIPPDLDKGALIANMGQFVKYIEALYQLVRYYQQNKVVL